MRADARARGFTLIEVLVALVVVGLGMLAVIQTVSQTAKNSSYMRDKTVAHWIAMNQLTQVRLLPNAPNVDKSSDEVEMAGREWRWTMEVKQTPVETIRRIEIRVRPADAPETSSMAAITGFYGTAVAPPGTTQINWQGTQGPGGPGQRGGGQEQRGGRDNGENAEPPPPPPSNQDPGSGDSGEQMPEPDPGRE